jgi:predicted component of type VI protein secretion system
MTVERYPGERRTLALFLTDLQPVVEAALGRDCLLFHAIRRALGSGELAALRHARGVFNQLPRELKAEVSAGLVARAGARAAAPDAGSRAANVPTAP